MDRARLEASKLIYKLTSHPKVIPDESTISASRETLCTDHMITTTWNEPFGWAAPELKPYGPLTLMPTASAFHHETKCFESMKVCRGYDGRVRLFNPEQTCNRLNNTARARSLPTFDPPELLKLITTLISVDAPRWLEKERAGSSLHVRPALIGTHARIGNQPPKLAMLYIILSLVPRVDEPLRILHLLTRPVSAATSSAEELGDATVDVDRDPTSVGEIAQPQGYFDYVLWLYDKDDICTALTEGSFFIVWMLKNGITELITAPVDGNVVLDSVFRNGGLELAREYLEGKIVVSERQFSMTELEEADKEGHLLESFVISKTVSRTWPRIVDSKS